MLSYLRLRLALCLAFAQLFKVPDYRYGKNLTPVLLRSVNLFLAISIDL